MSRLFIFHIPQRERKREREKQRKRGIYLNFSFRVMFTIITGRLKLFYMNIACFNLNAYLYLINCFLLIY